MKRLVTRGEVNRRRKLVYAGKGFPDQTVCRFCGWPKWKHDYGVAACKGFLPR